MTPAYDPLAALAETCGTCDGTTQVAWCPAWDAYLCDTCRYCRNDSELRVPLAVKEAMRAAAGTEPS